MSVFRGVRVALVAVVALLCAGCDAAVLVGLVVDTDGSGVVSATLTLDAEAAAQLAPIESAFATDDLVAAGWTVAGPDVGADGAATLAISKGFANPDELGGVFEDLSGSSGVFADMKLAHETGFATSSIEVTGSVALTGSLDQFSDAQVAGFLDGYALGRPPEEIATYLQANPDSFTLGLRIELSSKATSVDALEVDGDAAVATWRLGVDEVDQPFSVRTEANNRMVVLWLLLGAGAVVIGVVLIVAGTLRGSKRPAQRSGATTEPQPAATVQPTPVPAPEHRQAPEQRSAPEQRPAPDSTPAPTQERPRWSDDPEA